MAIRPLEEIIQCLFLLCACQTPCPLASHVCIFYIYKDIWQWQKAACLAVQWGVPANRYLLLGCELASTCCVHFAYFNVSHFSQPHCHCRAKGCRQESTGVWKVVWRLEVPVECHCFITTSTCYDCLFKINVVEISSRKFLAVLILQFLCFAVLMSNLHMEHTKNCTSR